MTDEREPGAVDGAGTALAGGSHSQAVRVGGTVRRTGRPWSGDVLALLAHLEASGFHGAPRPLGFDVDGREVLTFLDGEVGADLPDASDPDAGPVGPEHWVWRDDVLVRLGRLLRAGHDAAASFSWAGRTWQLEVRRPVETVCHNDVSPSNTVFRDGVPVALIDWEAAAPGPRAWDLGFVAWRWVPLWPDERCRAAGLPAQTAERARRLRLLLDAYGHEADEAFLRTTVERVRHFLDHLSGLAAAGSEWEVGLARRGVLDELARDLTWLEQQTATLLAPSRTT